MYRSYKVFIVLQIWLAFLGLSGMFYSTNTDGPVLTFPLPGLTSSSSAIASFLGGSGVASGLASIFPAVFSDPQIEAALAEDCGGK